jgi:hypothetical protein
MDSGLAAGSQVYAGCVDLPALRRPGMTTIEHAFKTTTPGYSSLIALTVVAPKSIG